MTKAAWSYCVIELETGGLILLRSKPTYWKYIAPQEWGEKGRSHYAKTDFEDVRVRYATMGWTCHVYRTLKHLPNGNNVGALVVISLTGRHLTRRELIDMIDFCKTANFNEW